MDPFYIDIILFSSIFVISMVAAKQKRIMYFAKNDVYITDTASRLFGKINKNTEKYIKDFYGSYETLDDGDRVYAYIQVKCIFKNIYFVGKDRIIFRRSKMHNLIDGAEMIKSRSGINKFKL
jgi:hypothetical protein